MKIVVAETAGFCMGVKRAVDMAIDLSRSPRGKSYTLGPVIHNRHTVEMLSERGVVVSKGLPDDPAATVLVRAHGIPPALEQEAVRRGHTILDGTCPKVKTVHRVISKYRDLGYEIVIAGDKGHAEVVGLMGVAGEAGMLVSSPDDAGELPSCAKVCLVSQTTFDKRVFERIADAVRRRYAGSEVVVKKTICAATDRRQGETREMAARVDAMIVVGGKHSANTRRLAAIARDSSTPTQHVESETDIDLDALAGCETIGVTAGASTPNWMIKRVVDHLRLGVPSRKRSPREVLHKLLDVPAYLNVFSALGASAAYYASCVLQDITPSTRMYYAGAAVCFLYFFSMHLWNSLASIEMTSHLGLGRYRFYNRFRKLLLSLAGISMVALLSLSLLASTLLFYLMLFAVVVGLIYHVTIVPPFFRSIVAYRNLKDIPTSRDLFVSLAWCVVITLVPHTLVPETTFTRDFIFVMLWIFLLAYLRSVILDLRDIEGDRIMGRETLVTIIGEQRVRKAMQAVIVVAAALLCGYAALVLVIRSEAFFRTEIRYLLQLPAVFYMFWFIRWNARLRLERPALFNLLADTQFFLCSGGAWLATRIAP